MPPKKSPTLTEAELRLMEVLWQKGPATVHQVLEGLAGNVPSGVQLRAHHHPHSGKKGLRAARKEGRAHVYAPLVGKQEATRFEIKNLVGRFFKNSHELLVLNILEDKNINADELKRLSQLLQQPREKP